MARNLLKSGLSWVGFFAALLMWLGSSARADVGYSWPSIPVHVVTSDGQPAQNVLMVIYANARHHDLTYSGSEGWARKWRDRQLSNQSQVTDADGNATFSKHTGFRILTTWTGPVTFGISLYSVRVPGKTMEGGRPCASPTVDELYAACPELRSGLDDNDLLRLSLQGVECKINATRERLEEIARQAEKFCVPASN